MDSGAVGSESHFYLLVYRNQGLVAEFISLKKCKLSFLEGIVLSNKSLECTHSATKKVPKFQLEASKEPRNGTLEQLLALKVGLGFEV